MPRTQSSSSRLSLALLLSLLAAVLASRRSSRAARRATRSLGHARRRADDDEQPTEPAPTAAPTTTAPKQPTNPDDALAPEVTSVTPDKATVGSVGPSIVVAGTNFVPRSIVQLDGAPLATSFVSGTELRATIPTSKLTAVARAPPLGRHEPAWWRCEQGGHVRGGEPGRDAHEPLSALGRRGHGRDDAQASGTGFVPGAKVVFGATDLTTTFAARRLSRRRSRRASSSTRAAFR